MSTTKKKPAKKAPAKKAALKKESVRENEYKIRIDDGYYASWANDQKVLQAHNATAFESKEAAEKMIDSLKGLPQFSKSDLMLV